MGVEKESERVSDHSVCRETNKEDMWRGSQQQRHENTVDSIRHIQAGAREVVGTPNISWAAIPHGRSVEYVCGNGCI